MDRLFELLQTYKSRDTFNQYCDCDPDLELPNGAAIRRRNLRRYLNAFADASYVLVGEAAGYAGCRFSGIPFTGEAQIVGEQCLDWAYGLGFEQSSAGKLWRERSGQIVWDTFGQRLDCVLWNTFPWHPFADKPLSNRKPTKPELEACLEVLKHFLSLFPGSQVYAIGRVSERTLGKLGIDAAYIRHPSYGGKPEFERGIRALPAKKIHICRTQGQL